MSRFAAILLPVLAAALPAQTPAGAQKIDFQKQVWPILEKSCVECHKAPHTNDSGRLVRPKGGLILESRTGIEAGRKGKPVVIAGKPEDSELYQLVTLPDDDEDRMPPPEKKPPLSKEQKETLRQWIAEGASFGDWQGNQPAGAEPKTEPKTEPTVAVAPDVYAPLAKNLKPLPADTIQKAAGEKARIEPVQPDSPLLRVAFLQQADTIADGDLKALLPLKDHIAILQAGRTSITDQACATLALMPKLVHVDLRETQVTDAGVQKLAGLTELRLLNLFGTKVGDGALLTAQKLGRLEKLWVWQTRVSAEAVTKLREQRPGLKVVFAPDLPDAEPTPPQGGGRRRDR